MPAPSRVGTFNVDPDIAKYTEDSDSDIENSAVPNVRPRTRRPTQRGPSKRAGTPLQPTSRTLTRTGPASRRRALGRTPTRRLGTTTRRRRPPQTTRVPTAIQTGDSDRMDAVWMPYGAVWMPYGCRMACRMDAVWLSYACRMDAV